jgi:signal transduction histidine kinase
VTTGGGARAREDPIGTVAGQAAQEIGTALTAIVVALDRLERHHMPTGAEAPKELAILRDQTERLARLARHLLVLATPPVSFPVRMALNPEVERLVGLFRSCADRAGVCLRFVPAPSEVEVHGDPGLLREAVLALLENACRATESSDGRPWIEVTILPQQNGTAEVRVRDSGPGVEPEGEERIFLPFVSGWGREGMGLTRSRLNVAGLGGTLRVDRDPSGGATFVLSLESHHEEDRRETELDHKHEG